MFQLKRSNFYTRTLILVHSDFVSQFSRLMIYNFSHWNSLQHNSVFELCCGLSSFNRFLTVFITSTYSFISLTFLCFVINANFYFYLFIELLFILFYFSSGLKYQGLILKIISNIHHEIMIWYKCWIILRCFSNIIIYESAVSTNVTSGTGPINPQTITLSYHHVLIILYKTNTTVLLVPMWAQMI